MNLVTEADQVYCRPCYDEMMDEWTGPDFEFLKVYRESSLPCSVCGEYGESSPESQILPMTPGDALPIPE